LGEYLARLDMALAGLSHDDADRDFAWDMRSAARHLEATDHIEPCATGRRVAAILSRFETATRARLMKRPQQVIHNDANDHNIVVKNGKVAGLIDFGDAVLGHRSTELAVACAYAMCGDDDPFGVCAKIVAGYHAVNALGEDDIALIPDLIETRIAMSIAVAARQHIDQPDNDYLLVSQAPFRALLERLAKENAELARFRLRDACGLSPNPATPAVVRYLNRNRSTFAPVCDVDLADPGNVLMLDLSTTGEHAAAMRGLPDTAAFTAYILARMAEKGASVAVGRYLEKRGVYTTDAYRTADPGERRDRHLGVDLFIAAGEPVYTPIAGVVEGVANNDAALDFGPTVIVRHETDAGAPFWTLYGHLSIETLDHLAPGQTLDAGDTIGWVGDFPINGDWPPHLHFQVMTSLPDMGTGIHGVGTDKMLDTWESVFIDPELVIRTPFPLRAPVERTAAELRFRRRVHLGRMLSLSYSEPVKIVRGRGQYLFDEHGKRYLDMVNNVCHVGHCHPRVVAAGQRQMGTLNTNTRYLHDNIVEFAKRLATTLPDPLSACFFVNSGSEANDLALRLARAHTGRDHVLVLEQGYHGHVSAAVDVSPYKFAGRGGRGRPDSTRICELPDTFRGRFRHDDPDAGAKYATSVESRIDELAREGAAPAAFIAESLGGVSGQLVLPAGYLESVYRFVRDAGGVCIADEVQVGLGRMGAFMWGFETQGVVPDIVTIGKPLGNGHPVAAVVTTAPIAESFNNGMEYFNTFGGNPVSCAIGLAVLDAIVTDGLMENAMHRGRQLLDGLSRLGMRHALIGDVRGIGLFVGAELVRDRDTLEPATTEARALTEYVKRRGILLSTDGRYDNVLKIKPPICIADADVEFFLDCLDDGLTAVAEGALRTQRPRSR
ncbi:MAG: aminotransferase class III-fold pyridoxal phosphate-dependent enzyme, partial [Proteobacteria bacterium]